MIKQFFRAGLRQYQRYGWVALCVILLPAAAAARKKDAAPQPPPLRATLKPSATIVTEPLGFAAPGEFYLGARQSLVSLDFLDENHLLFTFRVPGLIRRDAAAAASGDDERRIRALVLSVPDGNVEAETVWTVHDRRRYVYMLDNGQFLFRDRDSLSLGDASLQLKPFLHFPGPVLWMEIDPSRQYLVTTSYEPPDTKTAQGDVGSPVTAQAQVTSDETPQGQSNDMVLRILRRDTGQVMLVSRVSTPIHLPIDSDGYLEILRGLGMEWNLNLSHFTGGSRLVGRVDSQCSPVLNFLSAQEFVADTCGPTGEPRLVALSINGRHLWETPPGIPSVWPLLAVSSNGLRLAWESLMVDQSVNAAAPLGTDDIKGQDVQVMDAATGRLVLRAAASPVFDAGGNVAISPSGRKAAIIMNGNIQLFDLPAPASLEVQTPVLHRAAR